MIYCLSSIMGVFNFKTLHCKDNVFCFHLNFCGTTFQHWANLFG